MKIAVIGAGNVGGTLGRLWARAGHEVTFAVRDPGAARATEAAGDSGARIASVGEAVAPAEVVVLATPWDAAEAALRSAGDLAGKVLIDCTNPLGPGLTLTLGHTTSGAEAVAGWAAGARVVKAYNTTGYNNFAAPRFGAHRAAMFLCGDDAAAKADVAALTEQLGFEAVDCGPLANARLLEPAALLWIWLALRGSQGRDFAFGLLRRDDA